MLWFVSKKTIGSLDKVEFAKHKLNHKPITINDIIPYESSVNRNCL